MHGTFAGVHSPENIIVTGVGIGYDNNQMAQYMLEEDHRGIFKALDRDDVVFIIPETGTAFVFDITHKLDMSGLQVLDDIATILKVLP